MKEETCMQSFIFPFDLGLHYFWANFVQPRLDRSVILISVNDGFPPYLDFTV